MYDKEKAWGRLKLEQLAWLEEDMEGVANGTVLDAGCGPGPHLSTVIKKEVRRIIALDISAPMLKAIKMDEHKDSINAVCADLLHLPIKSESVDIIICFDTLHHIQGPTRERAIRELIDVANKGSHLCLDIKNSWNPLLYLRYRGREDSYLPISSMSPRELRRIVSDFCVIEEEKGIGFPLRIMAPWITYRLKKVSYSD
ncbi:MAG: class I SAM-dependent methyltransferase [Thermoproteota archaeon]